ncbi:MAG TPA: methylmalonyl-CoA mutase family protein, partial [Polyangiaceae bacterium]
MTGVRNCVIEVDGQAYDALYQDLIAVEVSERVNEPSSFALQIGIFKQENGSWTRLDETESSAGGFSPWQRVTVALSFDSAPDLLIDGLVAGISPRFTATEGETHLLVWGYDISYKMDLDERVVAWPDKKYSDIAAEIFGNYGLTPNVTDTQVLQTQSRDLLIQRGTDWQFLKRLASHIGFDVSVHGTTGYFRPPDLSRAPQKDLAVNFGQEGTNVAWFEPRLVGDLPGKISMARVNAVTKRIEKIAVSQSPLRALGKRNANALRQGRGISSEPLALGAAEPSFNEQAMEYHIREAGATAVQELAFTLADGLGYVQLGREAGIDVDEFAPRLSFFFDVHNDFFEEIAKFRAARRMWARFMRDRFGAKDPRSLLLRTHAQTVGVSLTAQQPYNNVVRVALQALAAVLGGTQSLHTNSLDETYALPTEDAVTLALRTQQLIAHESGVANAADPLGGSW